MGSNEKCSFFKIIIHSTCVILVFIYGVIVGTYQVFPHAILDYVKDSVIQVYEERHILAVILFFCTAVGAANVEC